jgi:ATP-dependent Clp protease ATP-binding subunit ClpC
MFEKFTEGAIKVIMLSQEEARRMGHNFVGTEQLLLGVIGQRHGIGARALKKSKVTLKKARKEIELYIGRGTGFVASEIPFTPRAKRVLEMAVHEGKDLGQNFVGTEHILLALIAESDGIAMRTLDKLNVDIQRLRNLILNYIEETQEEILRPLTQAEKFLLEREKKGSPTPTLDEYAENITKEAIDGNLDPVIGREKEIDDVIAVLARRTKNNPVLIGEPGVGKTAVAEGLAQLILTEKVPDFLDGSLIMALDLGSILAGTKYRGEFEERLKRIVEEAQNDSAVIIVIDEIHTLVGAGAAEGAVDAANILKPALARGKFRCIGATTNDEYRKYIERDPALERRFQPVHVKEPSVGVTIEILRGLRSKFEQHHTLSYHDKALEQAAILSDKYVADRYLPDKAIDVLDEAGARVRLENRRLPLGLKSLMNELQETIKDKEDCIKVHDFEAAKQLLDHEMEVRTHIRIMKQSTLTSEARGFTRRDVDLVNESDISDVVSNWTGIPVTKITGSESARLLKMEDTLHQRIIGQKHAVVAVSKAIRRARVGLRNPNRPIASFIFAGPTGVGKTELTKALSDYMFGSEESMIRLDMSEYMEKHTVAKLIGSPPGYVGYNEGGQLTEAVRSKPYSVVLLDEVEKAHPDVFNLLLQILDDGRLTDSKGRLIDFTNTLIIMTTNLGAKIIERESGIKSKTEQSGDGFKITPDEILGWEPVPEPIKDPKLFERVTKLVNDELKNFFRPEFLNRLDEIIVFNHLTRMDIWEICALMIKQVQNRLKDKDIELLVELSVQAFLTDEGYDPIYGARPLRRAIMKYLEDTLAEQCLSKTLYPGTKIHVRRKKIEGTLMTYTNEIEVEVDFSDVENHLIEPTKSNDLEVSIDKDNMKKDSNISNVMDLTSDQTIKIDNSKQKRRPSLAGRASRFFKKKK